MTDLAPLPPTAKQPHCHDWVYMWHDPDAVSEWTCEGCSATRDGNLPEGDAADD